MNPRESSSASDPARSAAGSRARAQVQITVNRSAIHPVDQTATPALLELQLQETFTGDIEADSTVRALQVRRDDRSAEMVSLQRVCGSLAGKRGSFVLQGAETVDNGKIRATWFVIRGSGTDELRGLRGEGGFEGEFGQHSHGSLEYWFEEKP